MTPGTHTQFAIALFLALSCLLEWSGRRHRRPRKFRSGVTAALRDDDGLPQG